MTQSARFAIGFLQAAQVSKEVTVNEALATFDIAVSAAVDGFLLNSPPASPAIGSSYVIGASPTGAWVGHPLALAGFTSGGWRYIAPFDGLGVLDKGSGQAALFADGAWEKGHLRGTKLFIGADQVVGARGAAVADPAGGTTVDSEARAAIVAILGRLRAHGLISS